MIPNGYSKQVIQNGVDFVNTIITKNKIALTKEEKLIVDLPLIMWGIGWYYSAAFMSNWMVGHGKTFHTPYEWLKNYERFNVGLQDLSNKLSKEGIIYDIKSKPIKEALDKTVQFAKTIDIGTTVPFGSTKFENNTVPMNYLGNISIGSAVGDLDDLGGSYGRLGLRYYLIGTIKRISTSLAVLSVNKIIYRARDEFEFAGKQDLGCWLHDVAHPTIPSRCLFSNGTYIPLTNQTFRDFVRKTGMGRNFYANSEILDLSKNPITDSVSINLDTQVVSKVEQSKYKEPRLYQGSKI
jgi:hypothetical protein